MNIIAQLGRVAAQHMMKQAAPPTSSEDYGNHFLRSNIQPLPTESDPDAASARAKYRDVPVSGGGGSMWGDEVLGRGGVHPDSRAANNTINKQYGAKKGPLGQPFDQQQAIQSQRLLAQDPRGKGGWAYEDTPQQRPVSQTNSNPWAIYGGSAATAPQAESTPGSRASHRPLEVYGDNTSSLGGAGQATEPRRSNNYGM